MKLIYCSILGGLLLLAACKPEISIVAPDFDVTVDATSFAVGEEVTFELQGNPGILSFYSGELFHDYQFRTGRTIEPGTLLFSFDSSVQYGAQSDQLSVLASTDFNGDYSDILHVQEATWTDITERFTVGSNAKYRPSGSVDITDLMIDGQPFYLAFRYILRDTEVHGAGRQYRINNLSLISETSIGIVTLAELHTAGFQIVDMNPGGIAPTNSALLANFLRMAPINPVTDENKNVNTEAWAITKAMYGGTMDMGPDRAIPIKGNADAQQSTFSYIFTEPGTYNCVFVAVNANVNGSKEVVRELTLTVTPEQMQE